MTLLLDRHAARGARMSRRGLRLSRGMPPPLPVMGPNTAPLRFPGRPTTEDDLNYYYHQIETLWLAGYATTFEQIHDHLPVTERAHLIKGLAALMARNWLKLQELPV